MIASEPRLIEIVGRARSTARVVQVAESNAAGAGVLLVQAVAVLVVAVHGRNRGKDVAITLCRVSS